MDKGAEFYTWMMHGEGRDACKIQDKRTPAQVATETEVDLSFSNYISIQLFPVYLSNLTVPGHCHNGSLNTLFQDLATTFAEFP